MNKLNKSFLIFLSLIIFLMFFVLGLEIDKKDNEIIELKQELHQSKSYARELQNVIEMELYLEMSDILEEVESNE